MASTDNGKQVITFRYQQEGTAEGFNKLLNGVIPTGVISGGELSRLGETNTVNIAKMQMIITDGNVTVHVQTTELATVTLDSTTPYIVATFNWMNLVDNYVSFEAVNYSTLVTMQNVIILGRGEFEGANLLNTFDYTRRTWSPYAEKLNNDFLFTNPYNGKSPSFNVSYIENSDSSLNIIGFNVGVGRGIIGGKEVEIQSNQEIRLSDNDTDYHKIIKTVNNGRIDIAVLMSDSTVRYIMGKDSVNPQPPIFPSNGLTLATFTFSAGQINYIRGSQITNIYNNNYRGFSPTIGEMKNGVEINKHTLYL